MFLQKLAICVYPNFAIFLPFFAIYGCILTKKTQKHTYSIILEAKIPKESEKIGWTQIWNFWSQKGKRKIKLRILTQKWPERVKIDPDAQNGV